MCTRHASLVSGMDPPVDEDQWALGVTEASVASREEPGGKFRYTRSLIEGANAKKSLTTDHHGRSHVPLALVAVGPVFGEILAESKNGIDRGGSIQRCQLVLDVLRPPKIVGVEEGQDRCRDVLHTAVARCARAPVLLRNDREIFLRAQPCGRPVCRAIIDNHNFVRPNRLRPDARDGFGEITSAIEYRDYDRDSHES